MSKIRVLLADDHDIVRDGIKLLLEKEGDIQVIGEASNGTEALTKVGELSPDVTIMDISMPEMNGLEATRALTQENPTNKILILSMYDNDDYIMKSIEYGASGFILKGANREDFIKAIHTVSDGQKYFSPDVSAVIVEHYLHQKTATYHSPEKKAFSEQSSSGIKPLTKREKALVNLIIQGYDNKAISEQFNISIRTVETHRFNIMKKVGVNNAADLVRVAIQNNLGAD
ncbi:MAG: response regulator transcription factor [Flammeovirgaceae bacterium]